CATPLFTTLAVWRLYEAVRRPACSGGRLLALSGLCWGLALQAHPMVVAVLPGAAIFLFCHAPPLLRPRSLRLAAGLVLLLNLILLLYNVLSGFDSINYGREISAPYTAPDQPVPQTYHGRVAGLTLCLFQSLGGGIDQRDADTDFLPDPGLWPMTLLAAAGLVWQWRRGNQLPALML